MFSAVSSCGAIAQWSEHWYAKPEALGSIPSCAAWIFSVPPYQCECFLSFDWCVGNGLVDV